MRAFLTVFNLNVLANDAILRDWFKPVLVEEIEEVELLYNRTLSVRKTFFTRVA